jgi:hypothetical protein
MDAVITEEPSAAGHSELISIGESIRPVKVSIFYQLGLVVVAGAMVLLPLIYVGLVGLFGYGVYYHATENVSILSWQMTGRLVVIKFLIYVAPSGRRRHPHAVPGQAALCTTCRNHGTCLD